MLTEITLENFKCFQEATTFPLSKINLLTGINGRGKSTLLQSLLLMKQSLLHINTLDYLVLNGNLINIGLSNNIKNIKNTFDKNIKISFGYNENYTVNLNYNVVKDNKFLIAKNADINGKLNENLSNTIIKELDNFVSEFPITVNRNLITNELVQENKGYIDETVKKAFTQFVINQFHKIHYISADRIGATEYYKSFNLSQYFATIDKRGENLASILEFLGSKIVKENLYLGENEIKDVETQTGMWLGRLFGDDVKISISKESPYVIPLIFTIGRQEFTPPNVGFGYSHVLPIIVAGLIAEEGEILIIENPEAHLHPKAQSELTTFLAKVASCGVQVFIESHSDHILNGLRIAVKQKILAPDDTKVLYFSKNKDTNENKIYYPKIDENGRIDQWKEGFFDEWDNSLLELA